MSAPTPSGADKVKKWTAKAVQHDRPALQVEMGGIVYRGTITRTTGAVYVQDLQRFFTFTAAEIVRSLNTGKALRATGRK